MKKIVVAIVALAMMVSAIAAMADSEKGFTITPRLAYNFVLDNDARDEVGDLYGISADVDIASLPVGFELGYMYGSKSTECYWGDTKLADYKFTFQSVPVLVTYKYPFADQFYAKAAAGVAFDKFKANLKNIDETVTESKTRFAFALGAGWNFLPNWSTELAYVNYGKVDDSNIDVIQLNVGYSF